MAVFAPLPSASETTATAKNAGFIVICRKECRRSARRFMTIRRRALPNVRPTSRVYEILGRFRRGVPMPRYLTQHTLACLTRQGAEALAQRMRAGGTARADRVLVNMLEGKMFVEFRAESREALELWLKSEGMHFDSLMRIEWEMRGDTLEPAG